MNISGGQATRVGDAPDLVQEGAELSYRRLLALLVLLPSASRTDPTHTLHTFRLGGFLEMPGE